jgi:hypothetical protein
MSKVGRNDPCPCGSGKKYKACCLNKDEAERRIERRASNAALNAQVQSDYEAFNDLMDRSEESQDAAASIWALIEAKQFDLAEQATQEYIAYFVESPIGFDLMSYICEARGELSQAAQWLGKVIDFMRQRPQMFHPGDEAL